MFSLLLFILLSLGQFDEHQPKPQKPQYPLYDQAPDPLDCAEHPYVRFLVKRISDRQVVVTFPCITAEAVDLPSKPKEE